MIAHRLSAPSPLRTISRALQHRSLLSTLSRSFATPSSPPTPPTRPPRPSAFPSATSSPPRPSSTPSPDAGERARQAVVDAFAQKRREERTLHMKNFALAGLLFGFVVWSYFNSVRSVRSAADSITSPAVAEIERELDEEAALRDKQVEQQPQQKAAA